MFGGGGDRNPQKLLLLSPANFTATQSADSSPILAHKHQKNIPTNANQLLVPSTQSSSSTGIHTSKMRHHSAGNLLLENNDEDGGRDRDVAAGGKTGTKKSAAAGGGRGSPRKGILKRPHTFHNDRERPASAAAAATAQHTSTFSTFLPKQPFAEAASKSATLKAKQMVPLAMAPTIVAANAQQPDELHHHHHQVEEEPAVMKAPQHVEFSDKNAVTVFGDTTTDTEAGGGEPNSPSARKTNASGHALALAVAEQQKVATAITRLPTAFACLAAPATNRAIVSPLVRPHKNEQQQQDTQRTSRGRDPSPEGSESGSSVRSGGTSHIVGKWWFGKSTKFVVHCDRRGCSHGHGGSREGTPEDAGGQQPEQPYLTPTQRKQQEIANLKKELRRAQLACHDKEHHLAQLRERLVEIESMMSSSTSAQMTKCAQLRQRLAEQEEEFVAERDALIARHEHKVRQLVQEMVDLRAELARKEKALAERDCVQRKNQCVQTEDKDSGNNSKLMAPSPMAGANSPTATTTTISEQQPQIPLDEGKMLSQPPDETRSASLVPTATPTSPSRAPAVVQMGAELVATLEAYRTETVVWRTRCANLELIMQDLLIREGVRAGDTSQFANALIINVDTGAGGVDDMDVQQQMAANDADPLTLMQRQKSEATGSTTMLMAHKLDRTRSMDKIAVFEREQSLQPNAMALRRSMASMDCLMASCVDRKRKLMEQNEKLVEETNRLEHELDELKERNAENDKETKRLMAEHIQLAKEHAELVALAETRLCQEKVAKLALSEVKEERDKLEQALSYLERRCRAFELIGLERGIVLVDAEQLASSAALKNEFRVECSQGCQTALTVDELGLTEQQLNDLQIRIRVLQNAFAEDKAQMGAQLSEIEHVLELKTQLINKLTEQMDEAARHARTENEQHQAERDMFMGRCEELGRVAERVPILESEIERTLTDKSRCELRIRELENQLDDVMDSALDTNLERNRLREEYWCERLDAVDRERKTLAQQLEHERRKLADAQMTAQLQKAELSSQLRSAIEHAAFLNAKLNCPRRDAQVDVRPRTNNKYISCKPNQRDAEIHAELRDEQIAQLQHQLVVQLDEKQVLLDEMACLEAEALEATEWMIQQQEQAKLTGSKVKTKHLDGDEPDKTVLMMMEQKTTTTTAREMTASPDFLTVSFHRKGELVQFGRASSSRAPSESTPTVEEGISIVSLPTVLEDQPIALMPSPHFRAQNLLNSKIVEKKQRSYSLRSTILAQKAHDDNDDADGEMKHSSVHFRREQFVLLPNMLTVPKTQHLQHQRCHSAPRRHEIEKATTTIIEEKALSSVKNGEPKVEVPTIQIIPYIGTAAELHERVKQFRHRILDLLSVGLSTTEPECTQREVQCTLGIELFDQMDGWLEAVAEQAKRSWHTQTELERVKRVCGRLRERLKDAEMELWIYRTEPRRAAVEQRQMTGLRSCSAEQLGSGPPLAAKQLKRWKVIAGTCFREVNQLRGRLAKSDDERWTLRNQVAILRGELVWAKCRNRLANIADSSIDDDEQAREARRKKRSIAEIEAGGETLESYNRWLGGDRWQSVPELDDPDLLTMTAQQQQKRRKMPLRKHIGGNSNGTEEIVKEALRKQFVQMKEQRDRLALAEQEMQEKLNAKETVEQQLCLQVNKIEAECALLRRENGMYEQKCVEMDKERQQMYLIMFRKGQQAASQEVHEELDKQAELQVVLRFLHDAFFYYLLNKGNAREHLQAIMTMLNFTVEQKEEVYRRKGKSH